MKPSKKNFLTALPFFVISLLLIFYLSTEAITKRQEVRKRAASNTPCQANITVSNSQNSVEFRGENNFNITIANNGSNDLTIDMVNEIWIDSDCNEVEDRIQCRECNQKEGEEKARCYWENVMVAGDCEMARYDTKVWQDVSLQSGESKTLSWSKSNWIPGYCFIHSLYTYSKPLNDTNLCWQGSEQGWQDAKEGNLQFKHNQAKFSSFSNLAEISVTNFGVVTHLDIVGEARGWGVQGLESFKKDVDLLNQDLKKLKLVRLAVGPWDIVNFVTRGEIWWNQEGLEKADEAINYAFEKGFQIVLTLSPWDNPNAWCTIASGGEGREEACYDGGEDWRNYSEELYNDYLTRFYHFLAERWAGKIYAWSPFNESDQACFTNYIGECKGRRVIQDPVPNYMNSDEYLNAFNSALVVTRRTIKSADPNTLIAAHVGDYPMSSWYFRSVKFFDKVVENIDIVAASLYPNKDNTLINQLSGIVDFYRHRYQKPVFILETGNLESCTSAAPGSATCQEKCPDFAAAPEIGNNPQGSRGGFINSYLTKLNKHASAVFLYQIRDDINNEVECNYFGIRRADDSLKPSYSALIDFTNQHGQDVPAITPPPTATLTPTSTPTSICAVCLSGKPLKSEGNANCDEQINLSDFNAWLRVYLNLESASEEEKAAVDFNCSEENTIHEVNLSDFNAWLRSYQQND